MSRYNEGARGRARYWMERAQRAEAELEKYKRWLSEAHEGIARNATPPPEINQVQRGVVQGPNGPTWYEKPPSPPEGEPEEPLVCIWSGEWNQWWRPNSSGYTPDWREAGVYPISKARKILAGVGDEKKLEIVNHTPRPPQQAHGDALAALKDDAEAALDRCLNRGFVKIADEEGIRKALQALTASGVPYVPGSIRELPDKWFRRADDNALPYSEARREQLRVDAGELRYEMQKALASAPAVPDGMRTAWPTRDVLTKLADAADILLDRYNHDADGWEMIAHARDVARQRAAAPTDGRE